ncbi:MAG TPA: hypothetical protein VEB20_11855 [Azospirillaceae bacterium]|nr:hypothetical protein [Azospirillaceae bacterium]
MTDLDTRLLTVEERLDRIETRLNSLERAQPAPAVDGMEDGRTLQSQAVTWLENNPVMGLLIGLAMVALIAKIIG